ncbi:MAG: endonuclease/exonuclease/phosphatase family protein [Anaerolineae bacterium]
MRARTGLVRWGWIAIPGLLVFFWLFNVSRVGTAAEGCAAGCATAAPRAAGPLRVMSLNVLHDFPHFQLLSRRLDLIADEIRRQEADLVCLQEVPWTLRLGNGARYLAERTGMNDLYLRANGNRHAILFEEGEAILSRYPLRASTFTELTPRPRFFEHRVALAATAATPWGDVRVVVTHLTTSPADVNHAQALSLLAFVAAQGEGPTIIAGDFNAVEESPQIRLLGQQWTDTYRAVHPTERGETCCIDDLTAGPDEPLEKRIDYLFLAPGTGAPLRVIGSQRVLDRPFRTAAGWLWASDHVGLLAAFR